MSVFSPAQLCTTTWDEGIVQWDWTGVCLAQGLGDISYSVNSS